MQNQIRKINWKIKLFSILYLAVLVFSLSAKATYAIDLPCVPSDPQTTGEAYKNDVFNCVNKLYLYGLVIATIAAVFMIILAGYLYIFSGGNEKRVGTAKSFISTSLVGLAVLIVGFLILQQINPEILNIKDISLGQIGQKPWFEYGSGGAGGTNDSSRPTSYGPVGGGKAGQVVGKDGVTVCNGGKDTRGVPVGCSCYPAEIKAAAFEYKVEPALLFAIIQQESPKCSSTAVSGKGAQGLMQIIPKTAAGIGCAKGWETNPKENIRCAAKLLSTQILPSQPSTKYVLSAYNAGTGYNAQGASTACPGMRRWECPFDDIAQKTCNQGPGSFEETRNYVISAERYYNEAKVQCGN